VQERARDEHHGGHCEQGAEDERQGHATAAPAA
jgi:hypothetical protein